MILQLIIPLDFIFKGVKVDFLLIIIVVIGLNWRMKYGAGFGFMAGMLQDLFLGGMFGIFTVIKTLIGGLSGFTESIVFREKIVLPPFIIFVMTVIHETLVILLSEKLIFNVNYFSVLISIILPEAVLNAFIGFFVYYVYYKVIEYTEYKESGGWY